MPSVQNPPNMNPSVEDVEEEASQVSDPPRPNGDQPQFSWTELLSRHESALSSHLDMLNSVRNHVKDDEAVRTLSGMVETTNRLMLQFKVVKKQVNSESLSARLLCRGGRRREPGIVQDGYGNSGIETNAFSEMSSSASQAHRSRSISPSPVHTKQPKRAVKRSQSHIESETGSEPEDEARSSAPKRRRANHSIPGENEDVRNATPVSMETEDISEEVNRRLRIKEEKRKRKDWKSGKRKRESGTSNESNPPRGLVVKRQPKRLRAKYSAEEGDLKGHGDGHGVKRRESDHSNPEDKRVLKRTKREPLATTTT